MKIASAVVMILVVGAVVGGCASDDAGSNESAVSAAATEQPAATTEQPAAATEQPVVTTEQPAAATEQPVATTEQAAAPAKEIGTRVIASWDVVPYQIVDKPFKVGVVAFHETGCKVAFAVSAGGMTFNKYTRTVDAPTLNDRVNVWEYWIEIDPRDIPDGPFEVTASAIPLGQGNTTTELKPMPLYANSGKSLKFADPVWVDGDKGDDAAEGTEAAPLKSLAAGVKKAGDGGAIYLKPFKEYSANGLGGGFKRLYWTTITAAPGVARDDVEIGPGRPGTEKLCFRNVTLYSDPPKRGYNTILAGEQGKNIVWLDNCKAHNRKGRWGGGGEVFGNRYVPYLTGGITTEMDNGPGGVLMRNHRIVRITSDAFTGTRTAINSSVEDIDPEKTGAHPDFHQSYVGDRTKFNSVILYNVRGLHCISQGFFGHNLRDSAFVNCLFEKHNTVMYSQYSGPLDHVLFIHITLPNQTWLWRAGLETTNCYMIDSIINNMGVVQGADVSGLKFLSNHFIGGKTQGEAATTGDPLFANVEASDYHLTTGSPAAGNALPLQCVPADIDGKMYDRERPSRGCFAGTVPAPEKKPESAAAPAN